MVDKLLDNIKEIIAIEKFDETKILINMDDQLSDQITLKRVVILLTWYWRYIVIKDGDNPFPQLSLDNSNYGE